MAYTWTETMQTLEPVGVDRWPYELALKYGIRDALTCSVGQRWLVAPWSRHVLSDVLTHPLRMLLIAAAGFAASRLEAAISKLDKYQLLILDDIAYVSKDQAETSVIFELIAARYERRSLLITANQPFGEWGKIFTDKTMTLAAIDRLVHHATILEMNVESYRRKVALKRKRGKAD